MTNEEIEKANLANKNAISTMAAHLHERLSLDYGTVKQENGESSEDAGLTLSYSSESRSLFGTEVSPSSLHLGGANDNDEGRERAETAGTKLTGRLLLFGVSFLYGTLNVVFRWVYELPDPPSASALSAVRGWMAAACFIPFLLTQQQGQNRGALHDDRSSPSSSSSQSLIDDHPFPRGEQDARPPPFWRIATELAVWNFGAQGLVNVGLLWTESARASFLTQTSVVMTPVVSAVAGHPVRRTVWLACACAMGGLVLLSSHGQSNGEDGNKVGMGFGFGDILCLLGAFCWSMYIFRLSAVGDMFDEVQMQATKTVNLALLYTSWFLVASLRSETSLWPGWRNVEAWVLLFYSAFGPGTVADLMQQKGQAIIPASESNVILSMEPVFTSLLGRVILGEATSLIEKLGGSLIILAAIVATR
jgi:drug/metabolite transporter (DMT)-like permease